MSSTVASPPSADADSSDDDLSHDDAMKRPTDSRTEKILSGPLVWTVLWLAGPILGEQLLNSIVSFYDVYLAGNLSSVGADPVASTAAVGLAAYVGWLAAMLATFVGAGTSALVSRFWGSGRRRAAELVANRSLAMAFLLGLFFATLLALFAPAVVRFVGVDGDGMATAVRFLRFDTLGYPAMIVSLIGAAALRGSGDTLTPMYVLVAVNLLNIAVSTALAFGGLGLDGVVAGTVTARWVGMTLILAWLATGRGGLHLIARQLKPVGPVMRRVVRIGAPAAFDGLVMWAGHVLFLKIVGAISPEAFAAHIAGIRVESFTYLSATAFGAAAATMIGQNLGASRAVRARRAGHVAVLQGGAIGAVISLAFIAFAGPIMQFMNDDLSVQQAGTPALWLVGFFQVPLVMSIVYVSALRGAGQTRLPVLITLVSTWLIRLPLAYLFGVTLEMGLFGAWLGMCLDMLVRGVSAAGLYVLSRWETTRV